MRRVPLCERDAGAPNTRSRSPSRRASRQSVEVAWLLLAALTILACVLMWKTLPRLRARHPQVMLLASFGEAVVFSLAVAWIADAPPDWAYFIAAVPLFGIALLFTLRAAVSYRKGPLN